jgi:hypothetical protein
MLQQGRVSDQSGGHLRLVQGSTVRLPANRAEICDWSIHGRIQRSSFQWIMRPVVVKVGPEIE